MSRRFGRLIALVLLVVGIALVTSCAQVSVVGQRADAGNAVYAGRIYVYTFLSMNPSKVWRVNKGIKNFNPLLEATLRQHHFDATVEDAKDCALRNSLPLNTVEADVSTYTASSKQLRILPVAQVIKVNSATEKSLGVTHRLVLFPANTTVFASYGDNVSGDVAWVLIDVSDDKLVASGTLNYMADLRGFPDKEMAEDLASKLDELKIYHSP